jgi:hypothetical protein
MPFLTYFAVMGPLLLGGLLALSAYLEPDKAPSTAELLGIPSAQAHVNTTTPKPLPAEPSTFDLLKGLPLNH